MFSTATARRSGLVSVVAVSPVLEFAGMYTADVCARLRDVKRKANRFQEFWYTSAEVVKTSRRGRGRQ